MGDEDAHESPSRARGIHLLMVEHSLAFLSVIHKLAVARLTANDELP